MEGSLSIYLCLLYLNLLIITMKRILTALLVAIIAFGASAEFRWGPTAGINISELYWKQDLVTNNLLVGPNAGVIGELMIPGIGFGVDVALKYSMHGSEVNFGEQKIWSSEGYGKEKLWFHTIQLPVNLRFKWIRMNGFEHYAAPFVYAGPVFNFNVSASKLPIIEHPAGSVALQCGLGGEFLERYQLSVGYYWGVSYDCRTIKLDNFSARSRGWQINVAVLF